MADEPGLNDLSDLVVAFRDFTLGPVSFTITSGSPAGFVSWTALPALITTAGLAALVFTVVAAVERPRWQLTASSPPHPSQPQPREAVP